MLHMSRQGSDNVGDKDKEGWEGVCMNSSLKLTHSEVKSGGEIWPFFCTYHTAFVWTDWTGVRVSWTPGRHRICDWFYRWKSILNYSPFFANSTEKLSHLSRNKKMILSCWSPKFPSLYPTLSHSIQLYPTLSHSIPLYPLSRNYIRILILHPPPEPPKSHPSKSSTTPTPKQQWRRQRQWRRQNNNADADDKTMPTTKTTKQQCWQRRQNNNHCYGNNN